jgi:hypothetical protein
MRSARATAPTTDGRWPASQRLQPLCTSNSKGVAGHQHHLSKHPLRSPAKDQRAGTCVSGPSSPLWTRSGGWGSSPFIRVDLRTHRVLLRLEALDSHALEAVLATRSRETRRQHSVVDPAQHGLAGHRAPSRPRLLTQLGRGRRSARPRHHVHRRTILRTCPGSAGCAGRSR